MSNSPVELKPDQFASELPKGPVVTATVVVDEQGERHHIEEISDGQVEHVDVVSGEIGPSPAYLQYDNSVEREPQQEDNGVDGGEQNTLEILVVGAVAVGDAFGDALGAGLCEGLAARKVQRGVGNDAFCEEGAKMSGAWHLYILEETGRHENTFSLTIFPYFISIFSFFFFCLLITICMLLLFTCKLPLMNWHFNVISVFIFKLKGVNKYTYVIYVNINKYN